MTDQELANKIIAILEIAGPVDNRTGDGKEYFELRRYDRGVWTCDFILEASEYVRDWRVAGAMMEKALAVGFMTLAMVIAAVVDLTGDLKGRSLPRAINEAAAEALE